MKLVLCFECVYEFIELPCVVLDPCASLGTFFVFLIFVWVNENGIYSTFFHISPVFPFIYFTLGTKNIDTKDKNVGIETQYLIPGPF